MSMVISNHSKHIWKLTCLSIWHLDLFYSRLNVCLSKWRWLLKSCDMLQTLGIKHAYNSISTSAIQSIIDRVDGTPEGSCDFDVHPLGELSLLGENVEMAIWGQGVDKRVLAGNSNKHLKLHLYKICWERFKDTFFRPLGLFHFFGLLIKVPKLEMGISSCDKVLLASIKCKAIDCLSEFIWCCSLLILEIPAK